MTIYILNTHTRVGKGILLLLLCGLLSLSAQAQTSSITIEASQNITNFAFKDSTDTKDKGYEPSLSGGYAIGYRVYSDPVFVAVKLGMRNAGATYVYDDSNYEWDMQYGEIRLEFGLSQSLGSVDAHFAIQPYYAFLLKANQRLNNENFDMIAAESIKKSDMGVFLSPGVNVAISESMLLYLDINYMLGLKNLETSDTQKSKNKLLGASVGLAFHIN